MAVINADDPYGNRLAEIARSTGSEVMKYGVSQCDFRAENIQHAQRKTTFRMVTPSGATDIETRLVGAVNVSNLLAAATAAYARGLTLDEIHAGMATVASVPGRFQSVDCGQQFTVIVDYAHTEDALRHVTRLARTLAASHGGRLITLFGCGGDRDRTKRPRMGKAAGEESDFVVLTSDNPRSEEPLDILQQILPGLTQTGTQYIVEPDRATAIARAIRMANDNDVVLLAGKGHEKVQILRDRTVPFDDAEVARAAILNIQDQ